MRRAGAKLPEWFNLSRYADAAQMDACDWFLNLLIRNWLARACDEECEYVLRTHGPLLRRHDQAQVNEFRMFFFGREGHAPSGFLPMLSGKSIPAGIDPLSVEALYVFERLLPDDVREAGASYEPGGYRKPATPEAFFGRVDHAFAQQMLGRFVRINLALPDDVLLEDLTRFLARERAELAAIGGKQPYREAVKVVDKTRGRNLGTLSTLQVLPFLDLDRWQHANSVSMTDYTLAKSIGLDSASRLKETRRYAGLALDELALRAWLEPLVRGIPPKSKRRRR